MSDCTRRIQLVITFVSLAAGFPLSILAQDTAKDVEAEYRAGHYAEAAKLATSMIEQGGEPFTAYRLRSACYEAQRLFDKAIVDMDHCIKLRPEVSALYQRRGELQFRSGNIAESLRDFDHFLQENPEQDPYNWQRGISYYYAGQYAEGTGQFERHKAVNPHDVENAVWHFLCKANVDGVDAAREALMEIEQDRRPWAMKVYELFQGKATPEQVIHSAEQTIPESAREDSLFYAHLYVGLYFESLKQEKKALQHIETAVDKYPSAHYMGDVARVHLQLRRQREK
jgi:tetratricopeptide (TPR) repeat protein